MKRFLEVLVLALVVGNIGGCGKITKEKLIGKWKAETDVIVEFQSGDKCVFANSIWDFEIMENGKLRIYSKANADSVKSKYGRGLVYDIQSLTEDSLVMARDVNPDNVERFSRVK